jgi:hypothetical protein
VSETFLHPPPQEVWATLRQYRKDLETLTQQHEIMQKALASAAEALAQAIRQRDAARKQVTLFSCVLFVMALILILAIMFWGNGT